MRRRSSVALVAAFVLGISACDGAAAPAADPSAAAATVRPDSPSATRPTATPPAPPRTVSLGRPGDLVTAVREEERLVLLVASASGTRRLFDVDPGGLFVDWNLSPGSVAVSSAGLLAVAGTDATEASAVGVWDLSRPMRAPIRYPGASAVAVVGGAVIVRTAEGVAAHVDPFASDALLGPIPERPGIGAFGPHLALADGTGVLGVWLDTGDAGRSAELRVLDWGGGMRATGWDTVPAMVVGTERGWSATGATTTFWADDGPLGGSCGEDLVSPDGRSVRLKVPAPSCGFSSEAWTADGRRLVGVVGRSLAFASPDGVLSTLAHLPAPDLELVGLTGDVAILHGQADDTLRVVGLDDGAVRWTAPGQLVAVVPG